MTLRAAPLLLVPQAVLLLGIGLATAWGPTGWLAAVVATGALDGLVVLGLRHDRATALGPADLVTATRATLTCAVTALVVAALVAGEVPGSASATTTIALLAAISLSLDLVDGRVARTTGTSTLFGARFDGEADAALMLVLSLWVAPAVGWWVPAIGLARYAFAAAGWVLPWLRAHLPARYWRKVVTAVTSTALVVASSALVPSPLVDVALLVGLVLVGESFGRDIWWLWRQRARSGDAFRRARREAYGASEFVDQQGFMRAGEIRALATAAGITAGTRVLDLCCGTGGPGRMVAGETGCDLLGVDASPAVVATARAAGPSCRYEVCRAPDLPAGPFDVVLLLETMLAFRDKEALLRAVHSVLVPGGRFACTVEEGEPLTPQERSLMPAADTVWPVPLARLHELLERTGFEVTCQEDLSRAHAEVVDSLVTGLAADRSAVAAQIGRGPLEDLLVSHRLWGDWLRSGRIRKFALVATARATDPDGQPGHRSDNA